MAVYICFIGNLTNQGELEAEELRLQPEIWQLAAGRLKELGAGSSELRISKNKCVKSAIVCASVLASVRICELLLKYAKTFNLSWSSFL